MNQKGENHIDESTEKHESYPDEISIPLSFEDFRAFCLRFLPATNMFETAIKHGYRLAGCRTMRDALTFIKYTVLLFHALKMNPGFKRLPKRKQIDLLAKMDGQFDESWIDDVPGMREVLQSNFDKVRGD